MREIQIDWIVDKCAVCLRLSFCKFKGIHTVEIANYRGYHY